MIPYKQRVQALKTKDPPPNGTRKELVRVALVKAKIVSELNSQKLEQKANNNKNGNQGLTRERGKVTLPETNIKHLKKWHPNRKVVFQPSIFRGYVSFREDIYLGFF